MSFIQKMKDKNSANSSKNVLHKGSEGLPSSEPQLQTKKVRYGSTHRAVPCSGHGNKWLFFKKGLQVLALSLK
jgi:hypothetical protein